MSTLPVVTFGALLRRYRLAAGLSQEELAEHAHLSREAISTLERGTRRVPRQETIELLAEALGLVPAERARLQQVARGQTAAAPAAASHPRLPVAREVLPLAGRRRELARLEQHLAGMGPPLLLLAGEPGIGKSRLLAEAAERARAQGWAVLESGCHRRSGQEPFAPLLGAFERRLRHQSAAQQRQELQGCAWLVRLLPELAEIMPTPAASWSLPPEQERRLMFAAVARYQANAAGPAGALLVLDDLQWAGADALDLLAHLLRAPGEHPLRVVGAYRSTEVRPPDPLGTLLADLGVGGMAGEIRLGPLDPEEARSLLQSVLEAEQGTDSALRAKVIERTGGVPYFLVSCAQALRLSQQEGEPAPDVPWNVAQSIRQRVAELPTTAQMLLDAAAVIGREAPGVLLLAVVAQPKAEQVAALEELDRARLLVESAEAVYQFPHDLIREVVLADLSALRRRQWHAQVAEALEQGPGEALVEQVAYHYVRAGIDERAVIYLGRAGDRALALHANAEAEGYFRQLLLHLERLKRPLDAAPWRVRLGKLLFTTGRFDEALEVLAQAETAYQNAGDQEQQWLVVAQMGHVYARRNTPAEGLQRLLPVLKAAGPTASPTVLAALNGASASLYDLLQRYQEGLAAAERAVELARGAGANAVLVPVLQEYSGALLNLGRVEEASQVEEEVLALAELVGDQGSVSGALGQLAWHARTIEGAFTKSRVYLDRALDLSERLEDPTLLLFHLRSRGRLYFLSGDWQAARADCERARALPSVKGGHENACYLLLILGQVSLAEGKWAEATRWLEEGIRLAERTQFLDGLGVGQATLAERDLLEGQPQAALARLEPLLAQAGPGDLDLVRLLPLRAWAALLLGEEQQAEILAEQAGAQTQQMRSILPDALRVQAQLRIQQQRWKEAQATLEETLELCQAMPYPYAEAKALYVYGLLHQAKGEPEQAHERLDAG